MLLNIVASRLIHQFRNYSEAAQTHEEIKQFAPSIKLRTRRRFHFYGPHCSHIIIIIIIIIIMSCEVLGVVPVLYPSK
jgi:hypothetical protein